MLNGWGIKGNKHTKTKRDVENEGDKESEEGGKVQGSKEKRRKEDDTDRG